MQCKKRLPYPYKKGDKVRSIFGFPGLPPDFVATVKQDSFWQYYAGGSTSDYTVLLEAYPGQPTPWNKSSNLEPAE